MSLKEAAIGAQTAPIAWRRLLLSLVAFVALEVAIFEHSGGDGRKMVLAMLGLMIGATLVLARFGFAGAFRALAGRGDASAFVAQGLMLALAALLIVPMVAAGSVFGVPVTGFATPVGPAFLVGAVLFGIGMGIAGGCASGTLFLIGQGEGKFILVLAGFILGSVLAAISIGFWWALPAPMPLTVFTTGLPWRVSLGAMIVACLVVAAWLAAIGQTPPARLLWGGFALAVLNTAMVLVNGRPWSETFGFALWGSKLAVALGIDASSWPFWRDIDLTAISVFDEATSITDFSILLGALAAATLSRRFEWRWPDEPRTVALALLAGMLMGYGARLSGGCNIGAYFSAIASGDFSGWFWALAALGGTRLGLVLRT